MYHLNESQKQVLRQWLPALIAGGCAWVAFILFGETPIVRASGLALVIIGLTLALRQMGAALSLAGGLTLAFSAAFWFQTGGGDAGPATIVIAVVVAALLTPIIGLASRRPYIGFGAGVIAFVLLFWSQVGTPRSLRLTSLVTAWLMSLLTSMLLLTNPRPDDAPPQPARPYHTLGILLLFTIGLLNDPLLTLLTPAIVLSLLLANPRLPVWYWLALTIAIIIGARGFFLDYLNAPIPLLNLHYWRDGMRWIDLVNLVIGQFSLVGVILGVLGVARLARWYPHLGTMTMIGYAAYAFFGLIYIGHNREILLLPLFIIQVIWMTYAIFTITQWLSKTAKTPGMRWVAVALYYLMPIGLFITNVWMSR